MSEDFMKSKEMIFALKQEYDAALKAELIDKIDDKMVPGPDGQRHPIEPMVCAIISEYHQDLEQRVLEPWKSAHGDSEIEFNDFTNWVALHKLALEHQSEFRKKAI